MVNVIQLVTSPATLEGKLLSLLLKLVVGFERFSSQRMEKLMPWTECLCPPLSSYVEFLTSKDGIRRWTFGR